MAVRLTGSCCFQTLKWIPVLFILAVVGWSYYAYVVQMCLITIHSLPKKTIYLCIYHPLLFLFLWSYCRTMFQSLHGPTREFYASDSDGEQIAATQSVDERRAALIRVARQSNLPLLTRQFDGSIRYCFICKCVKPDRAHHCSVCEKCVLRYDHHCPWTNSCISYGNYKFFMLFLGWALIFCAFVAATSLEYFINFWMTVVHVQQTGDTSATTSGKFHLLFLFFVAVMFGISVSSLFFYHLYLIGKNRTTLESFRAPIFSNGPQKDGFNLGFLKNYQEIFGNHLLKAFIPISTTRGDGIHYQVNSTLIDDSPARRLPIENNRNNNFSLLNRSDDAVLSLGIPSNTMNHDTNYLLGGNVNSR